MMERQVNKAGLLEPCNIKKKNYQLYQDQSMSDQEYLHVRTC